MTETTRRTSRTALVLSSLSLFALLGAGCGSKAATDAGETLDLAVAPDLKKPCGLGQHQCSPAEACIDESLCCTSAECAVSGSDCLPDHTCKCPAGRKACDRLCIPEANCCTKADCPVPGQTCQIDGSCQCPSGQKPCLKACIPLGNCCTPDDCMSKVCTDGMCALPACDDKVQNGMESDVDCGGGYCPGCAAGANCTLNVDCKSNVCTNNKCK